jgi:hypothetical protein
MSFSGVFLKVCSDIFRFSFDNDASSSPDCKLPWSCAFIAVSNERPSLKFHCYHSSQLFIHYIIACRVVLDIRGQALEDEVTALDSGILDTSFYVEEQNRTSH